MMKKILSVVIIFSVFLSTTLYGKLSPNSKYYNTFRDCVKKTYQYKQLLKWCKKNRSLYKTCDTWYFADRFSSSLANFVIFPLFKKGELSKENIKKNDKKVNNTLKLLLNTPFSDIKFASDILNIYTQLYLLGEYEAADKVLCVFYSVDRKPKK